MTRSRTTVSRPFAILACVTAGLLAVPFWSDSTSAQTAEPRVIDVVAKRYEFVPSTIEVVQGERVRIVVKSGDGFHGFGIEQFDVSTEIPRGETVTIEFTPDVAGEFPILCTVYCGDGHEGMKGQLVVKAREAAGQGAAPAAQVEDDPDLDLNPLQPDFTIVALPTTLRLPRFKSAFRVTHRFRRPLGAGDFGELVSDLFGIDSGANIGLEYRFGIIRGTQVGIRRTNDRTIEFFSQYNVMQQNATRPIGLGVIASVEGTNNFRDSYSQALGVAVSRTLGVRGVLYVEPIWVNNSRLQGTRRAALGVLDNDNDTFMIGLGARIRVRPTVYLVGEIIPRVAGYDPGVNHASFGIEKRAGGHAFQINFSNGFGTTMGQLARGGFTNDDWFLGFNISRKFF